MSLPDSYHSLVPIVRSVPNLQVLTRTMRLIWMTIFIHVFEFCHCKKNVLFIIADDLRPQLGAYNGSYFPSSPHAPMITPNIDSLASKSLLLKRAYVQQALCSPSRTSFLTGRRPDTTHVYDLESYFRTVGGDFTTIPQYFKMQGYETAGIGKIFHPGSASHNNDHVSWTLPYFAGDKNWEDHNNSWKGIPNSLLADKPLVDQQIADHAISTLRKLAPAAKTSQKQFFVAVGFHKPHLPLVYPQSFIHHYPWTAIQVPDNQYAPLHMPPTAWFKSVELRQFEDIKAFHFSGDMNMTLPHAEVIKLRRAYYTCITYIDSLIGNLLHELKNLGLENDTIVSFIGDHGFKLGEHGLWGKHTNFDLDTHAPMMIHIPGMTDNGVVSEQLTEFVDLFPTITEAAGVPKVQQCPENSANVATCHEGTSLLPLVSQPNQPLKMASFSQYPRQRQHQTVMGYTVTTTRYRYTEWVKFQGSPVYKPDWNAIINAELYDHLIDPNEDINRASYRSMSNIRAQLRNLLHSGWRNAVVTHHNQIPNIFG